MAATGSGETDRMVVKRTFDAPRELVWEVWTNPEYMKRWWGPNGFTAPVCNIDLRVGGKYLCCMKAPEGQEFWNAGEYLEVVPNSKIVYSMYFSDPEGNKVDPAQYGMEHKSDEQAHDTVLFEELAEGRSRLTLIGNESMEDAVQSGQIEGWNQILEKAAKVVSELSRVN